jgi:hypothetical protein
VTTESTPDTVEDATFLVVLAESVSVVDEEGVTQIELDAGEATQSGRS